MNQKQDSSSDAKDPSLFQAWRTAAAVPSINVTPLIDVLLVLLIIFMVIQPQREEKLPIRAPQAAHDDGPAPPQMLMLTMDAEWRLALNSKPVEIEDLLPLLGQLMQERPPESRQLLIKAPSFTSYGSVVLLIDLAKGGGVLTIGLIGD